MEIKELDKKQYILLTLLITFVVSIATGIVTVSLMNQMPKSVPQTINNVIQRTIEKVTTVQVPTPIKTDTTTTDKNPSSLFNNNSDALISIYLKTPSTDTTTDGTPNTSVINSTTSTPTPTSEPTSIGQGIIISDIGLILVDSSILTENSSYKVILDKIDFDATLLKKFTNGFAILKISTIKDKPATDTTTPKTDTTATAQ